MAGQADLSTHIQVTVFFSLGVQLASLHPKWKIYIVMNEWLGTLQHVPCINSAFDSGSTSLEHRQKAVKGVGWCS